MKDVTYTKTGHFGKSLAAMDQRKREAMSNRQQVIDMPSNLQFAFHPVFSQWKLVWCCQVAGSKKTPLLTCLLEGPPGSGKTALAAKLGLDSKFPFVKVISSNSMVGYSEAAKAQQIAKVFDDAYRVSTNIQLLSLSHGCLELCDARMMRSK